MRFSYSPIPLHRCARRALLPCLALLILGGVASACDGRSAVEPGPPGEEQQPSVMYVLVLPHTRIDLNSGGPRGFPITIERGDSLFLVLAISEFPHEMPRDSVRSPVWTLTDPSIGSIHTLTPEMSVFVAAAPGSTQFRANGQAHDTYVCSQSLCSVVAGVEVEQP